MFIKKSTIVIFAAAAIQPFSLSGLASANEDQEEGVSAVEPIDSEPAFEHELLESCPTEVVSLLACFDDVEAAKVCLDCVWIGLTDGGFPDCEDFHGKFESSMAACVEECNTEVCSDSEANLFDCAVNAIDCIQTASVM